MRELNYRPDVDGLRAIAVLAVVGYHAFPNWVRGGFVGVDIFFVISGFLISTILLRNLESDRFSFREFYSRRIRRIFPALAVVLAACLAFGWVALLADEYKQLGKHVAGGAGFISNFLLWSEYGYFDSAAETKPLLHLWSLGIEEQFYIVWPFLLWIGYRSRLNLLWIIAALGVASFAWNIGSASSDAVGDFYSPMTRFWELAIGSGLAYWTIRRKVRLGDLRANLLSVGGLVLIVMSVLIVNNQKLFPYWWALLPTIGALLIVTAGPKAIVNQILSSKALVWVGLISYPLYLWHWPLLSFTRIIESATPPRETRIVAVLISIFLAWLTYRLIEKPIRFGAASSRKVAALCGAVLMVGFGGYLTYVQDGIRFRPLLIESTRSFAIMPGIELTNLAGVERFEARTKKEPEFLTETGTLGQARIDATRTPACNYSRQDQTFEDFIAGIGECVQLSKNKKNILIIGDSFAADLYAALSLTHKEFNFLQITGSDCTPILSHLLSQKGCIKLLGYAYDFANSHKLDAVILAGRWPSPFGELRHEFARLKDRNKLIIVGPAFEYTEDVSKFIQRRPQYRSAQRYVDSFVDDRKISLAKDMRVFVEANSVYYVDRIALYCSPKCPLFSDDGEPFISDYGHLNVPGAVYLGNQFLANGIIEAILDSPNTKSLPLKVTTN